MQESTEYDDVALDYLARQSIKERSLPKNYPPLIVQKIRSTARRLLFRTATFAIVPKKEIADIYISSAELDIGSVKDYESRLEFLKFCEETLSCELNTYRDYRPHTIRIGTLLHPRPRYDVTNAVCDRYKDNCMLCQRDRCNEDSQERSESRSREEGKASKNST
jgi:hypothetical protein